jgi:hypothetical protein
LVAIEPGLQIQPDSPPGPAHRTGPPSPASRLWLMPSTPSGQRPRAAPMATLHPARPKGRRASRAARRPARNSPRRLGAAPAMKQA